MAATLEYIGSACFRAWRQGGPIVALDPYTPSILGLPEIRIEADVVVASSLIDDGHFCREIILGEPEIIDALDAAAGEAKTVDGAPITAVPATEDPLRPDGPRDCAMYAFTIGGINFVHMGDIGYGLDRQRLTPFIGKCDVLLALAGQTLTPSFEELDDMFDILQPKWIVPMHYLLEGMTVDFEPLDDFLAHRRDPVVMTHTTTVKFPPSFLSVSQPTIVVLDAAGIDRQYEVAIK